MNLHLRVLHGTLKRQDGAAIGSDIAVHGKRFVIGSGPDCNMRCPSSTISEYHCEFISEEGGIFLRDLHSEHGTFVNGERVTTKRPIVNGDHLRIGKLEFEVAITAPPKGSAVPSPAHAPAAPAKASDPVGDNISEMLSAADAEERERQKHDPASRQFVPPSEPQPAAQAPEKKKLVRPPKKPPGKLPPAPKVVADNTVNAAEEVLKKIFEKPKK
jgi:predicted component of type VI protein secretion system